ncbi:MAG TPA: transposase [Oscillatoriaceae cyanobacterium M33_DOE_052]|nr:transposase [Oscillatoriaceae cyanobacterium M33_DOE_052]
MLPATIVSIKQAFQEIKHFCVDAWEGDYRPAARQALKEILETRMHNVVDEHLERLRAQEIPDRRNGSYCRHLLTELGDVLLSIPRTRTFSPIAILRRFAPAEPFRWSAISCWPLSWVCPPARSAAPCFQS